jgi:hypothetical protein
MTKKTEIKMIQNEVLQEIIAEIQEENSQRCSFPFLWGNWVNWSNWGNWGNYGGGRHRRHW